MLVKPEKQKSQLHASLPKDGVDSVLYYLIKQKIAGTGKAVSRPAKRHPSLLFHYYKAFRMKTRLTLASPSGKALSLIKTQYAKKPKNPV